MSTQEGEREEELLRRYRQASDAEPAAPSAGVRAAILAEGRAASERHARAASTQPASLRRRNPAQWKYALFGTAAAALLAGVLVLPRFLQHPDRIVEVRAVAQVPAPSMHAEAPVRQDLQRFAKKSAESVAAADTPAAAPPAISGARRNVTAGRGAVEPSNALTDVTVSKEGRLGEKAEAMPVLRGAARSPLLQAVKDDELRRIGQLIDAGEQLEARDELGRTPLMLATILGRADAVAALLAAGADPNAADQNGRTPLQQAKLQNEKGIAALLEKAGAH